MPRRTAGSWTANYFGKLGPLVFERADTAVLLDLPLRVVFPRALWRTASRLVLRTEMWNGNRERLGNVLSRKGQLADRFDRAVAEPNLFGAAVTPLTGSRSEGGPRGETGFPP
jgi:hypothetical protein